LDSTRNLLKELASGMSDHRRRTIAGLVAAALFVATPAGNGHAQDSPQAPDSPPPPPDFLSRKLPLPEEILRQKREGQYITGIPLVGIDPELGAVLGAAVQVFDNGSRESPLFAYSPYRRQIQAGAQVGIQRNFATVYLAYDQPYVDDSPWRIKSYAGYKENKFLNYFGTGEETLEPLHYPGAARTFSRLDDFEAALRRKDNGITWSNYVAYQQSQVLGTINLEYDILGGLLRPLVGIQFSRIGVADYSGQKVDGATEQETKLAEDERRGRILGFDGGWDNTLRVGIAFDTRDYEPDPRSGVLAQALVSGSLQALGSDFDYGQATLGLTGYATVIPGYDRLVAVGNATYSVRFGDVPFYVMNRLALPKAEVRTGLGGFPTLRGYSSNRFVGPATWGANAELRWDFSQFVVWEQTLKTSLAPFVDTGRVFDRAGSFSVQDWKVTWGIGLKLSWNLATVVSFDYGVSPEGSMFYMELGHAF